MRGPGRRRLTRRQRHSVLVLALVAVAFIGLDSVGTGLAGARSGVRGTMGALYRGTDSVLGPARRWLQALPGAGGAADRVQALEAQNRSLRRRLDAAAADRATTRSLTRLRLAADSAGRAVLPARVLALAPAQGFDWTVTLDVGSADGVATDQSVTDGYGLVGRVMAVDSSTSVVLLAVDPGSGVGVRDRRTGELGLVTGAGTAGFSLRLLNPAATPRVGDALATGPAGSSTYAPGLAVGTVRAVHVATDGAVTAEVQPASDPTALDVVGVVGGSAPNAVAGGAR